MGTTLQRSKILSLAMSLIYQEGILFLFLLVASVSLMDPGTSSMSLQISLIGSQLSSLGSQLVELQEQVEVLQQEKMKDMERIVHLEEVNEEFERRVSLLESVCGTAEMETDTFDEEEVTMSTNIISASTESRPLMAIGGHGDNMLSSAKVLNTSCDFPLPEPRYSHISVTTIDGKTLVCSGHTLNRYSISQFTESCLQFDYESKSWKEHSPLLSKYRFQASAVTLSRGTYVLGGGERDASRSSEFLATGSSVWTQGPRISGQGVRKSCVAKLSDTEFVILGGYYHSRQAQIYDEQTKEWREWPRLPMVGGAQEHSCMGLGDIVLMAGGRDSSVYPYVPTGRTVIFNTTTGSAREVASLKYPRYGAAMALYRGKPIILGGNDGSGRMRSDGEMWNMDTETWEEADIHLNIARGDFSLVTMAEEIECN